MSFEERECRREQRWLAPALMDGHIHIESTMLTLGEFARLVVPSGMTTVMLDPLMSFRKCAGCQRYSVCTRCRSGPTVECIRRFSLHRVFPPQILKSHTSGKRSCQKAGAGVSRDDEYARCVAR